MKKFKLNAVIASILSLGIVCSGSVFASRVEGKDSRRIGKKVVICTKKDMEKACEREESRARITVRGRRVINIPKKKGLDELLKDLIECKENWINLRPLFGTEGWGELPLTSEEFTSKSIKCYEGLCCVLNNLRVQSLLNGLKHEFDIFIDLQNVCDEIYNKYNEEKK